MDYTLSNVSVYFSHHPHRPPNPCPSRYLVQNLEWLEEGLGDTDDDYYLFDCPGVSIALHISEHHCLVTLAYSGNGSSKETLDGGENNSVQAGGCRVKGVCIL